MKTIGVGLIGAGFIAESRARAYANVKGYDVQLVALAEVDAERGASYAGRHGVPKVVADYRQLLELPEVDLVDLCVPNALHYEMVLAAARAGKQVGRWERERIERRGGAARVPPRAGWECC